MRVTKAQAQANRALVIETASTLFRERGFDGVGVADLMAAAGFTHGGFYKQFGSKAELMAESAACGLAKTAEQGSALDMTTFVDLYLSREHRDSRAQGCTIAALGSDAARQADAVRTSFAEGIEGLLSILEESSATLGQLNTEQARAAAISTMAQAVGAIVMSRACPNDSALADEILAVCRGDLQRSLAANPDSSHGKN